MGTSDAWTPLKYTWEHLPWFRNTVYKALLRMYVHDWYWQLLFVCFLMNHDEFLTWNSSFHKNHSDLPVLIATTVFNVRPDNVCNLRVNKCFKKLNIYWSIDRGKMERKTCKHIACFSIMGVSYCFIIIYLLRCPPHLTVSSLSYKKKMFSVSFIFLALHTKSDI